MRIDMVTLLELRAAEVEDVTAQHQAELRVADAAHGAARVRADAEYNAAVDVVMQDCEDEAGRADEDVSQLMAEQVEERTAMMARHAAKSDALRAAGAPEGEMAAMSAQHAEESKALAARHAEAAEVTTRRANAARYERRDARLEAAKAAQLAAYAAADAACAEQTEAAEAERQAVLRAMGAAYERYDKKAFSPAHAEAAAEQRAELGVPGAGPDGPMFGLITARRAKTRARAAQERDDAEKEMEAPHAAIDAEEDRVVALLEAEMAQRHRARDGHRTGRGCVGKYRARSAHAGVSVR